jgi:hypothetical protein
MPSSFRLDDRGDKDTLLTVALLFLVVPLTFVNVFFSLSGFTLFLGPIITFVVTRAAYKWHFRRQLARLAEPAISN